MKILILKTQMIVKNDFEYEKSFNNISDFFTDILDNANNAFDSITAWFGEIEFPSFW